MAEPILGKYFTADANWVTVYRTLASVLRTDDRLSTIPVSWDVRVGDQNEGLPPTEKDFPWVALVPLDFDMQPQTEVENRALFRVRVDIAVKGTHWDDLGNFAGAVYDALRRNKPSRTGRSVYETFRDAGATNYWVRRAGVGVRRTETPPPDTGSAAPAPVVDQFSSAVVEFLLLVPDVSPDFPLIPTS